jgi:transcriptional regulator with GAF, ATPase, and Fis domain
MIRITRQLAERIADLARLLLDDEDMEATLRQLSDLALDLIPGSAAVGIVTANDASWQYSGSSDTVSELHRQQVASGSGPVVDAVGYGEARRIDNAAAEQRWPGACAAMSRAGYSSCLALPLRTDRKPGGALVLYGRSPEAFSGSGHDIALLFAAQGGVAVRNASAYRNCRALVANLHTALESRAVIEQAKGILVAEYGCDPETAFKELSRISQNTNRKVRELAVDLVAGRADRGQFQPDHGRSGLGLQLRASDAERLRRG